MWTILYQIKIVELYLSLARFNNAIVICT